jgi:hypothetical protein
VQDPVALYQGERPRRRVEQLRRRGRVEGTEPLFGQPSVGQRRVVAIAGGSQQHDRVRLEAAGDESEHVRRRVVEPVDVLGDQQQRRVPSHLRQQVQRGHGDAEVLRRRAVRETERCVECRPVRRSQVGRAVPHRPQ